MAPDFGLVAHPAQGKADEIAARGPGHGFGQRGLAHAGRTHKTENGAFQTVRKLLHGQVFQDALLGLFQAVVVAVQNGAGLFNVDVDAFQIIPGQVQNPVHIIAHHRVFGGRGRHGAQLLHFGERLLPGLFGHVAALELLLQLVHLGLGIVVAPHFLVNGLDLLVEVVLALVALHLDLDPVLDPLFHRGQGHFALQQLIGALQALGHVGKFQRFLLFAVLHLEMGQNRVGQRAGLMQGQDGKHGFL